MKYIDVSEHQGVIDWAKVKPAVDGVIIRAGRAQGIADKQWERNVAECNRLGIPAGAYWFSEAWTVEMARAEAQHFLKAVKPYRMELPLAYDYEEYSVKIAAQHGVTITRQLAIDMLYAFCETLEKAGYWVLVYTNPNCIAKYLNSTIPMRFGLWLASWYSTVKDLSTPPRSDCQVWQWGGSIIPGITVKDANGNVIAVDTNESYRDFRSVIVGAGMNNLGFDDGEGGTIYEHAQQPQQPVKPDVLLWAKNQGLCGDVAADTPVTWKEFAEAMYKLHGPQDG